MNLERGTKYKVTARYLNAQGWAVAIVALVTHAIDWAVYIGATFGPLSEEETVAYVVKYGCKLSEQDGRYFFPEFKGMPYRH